MKAARPAKPQPRVKPSTGKSPSTVARKLTAPKHVRTAVLGGKYRVFDTPIEPKHTTRERIAEVVAAYVK